MTFTHALSTNNYGAAKFIVDASAANGTILAGACAKAAPAMTRPVVANKLAINVFFKIAPNQIKGLCRDCMGQTAAQIIVPTVY